MTTTELEDQLRALKLTQTDAAQLLGVSARTVRRWSEGEDVPGPAEAALRAWRRLDERHLPWRPDSVSIIQDDQEQIALHKQHTMDLDALLRRVDERGGPRIPWHVNVLSSNASLGSVQVSFYKLKSGGFSLSTYRRSGDDQPPDVQRDWPLIEDAAFCIAKEFERLRRRADALNAVAQDVRSKSSIFGSYGPKLLNPEEKQERQRFIEELADQITALAEKTVEGHPTTYQQFAAIRSQLSDAGIATDASLVSEVARSYVERKERVRVLFVRSGSLENAVTKTIESDSAAVNKMIFGHRLKPLGSRLPSIGEPSRMQAFSGPDHVVLDVPRGVAIPGVDQPGLYLVTDLHPSTIVGLS